MSIGNLHSTLHLACQTDCNNLEDEQDHRRLHKVMQATKLSATGVGALTLLPVWYLNLCSALENMSFPVICRNLSFDCERPQLSPQCIDLFPLQVA